MARHSVMQTTLIVLACLVCAGHGRRVRSSRTPLQSADEDAQADVLQAEAQEFKMLDRDGDGFLSASEFRAFSNGTFKQIDDVRSLFEVADLDKDGKITNDEFADAEEVLLNTDDEHYHLFHDWAKHLSIVNKVEEYDESEDPENPDQDDESEDLENPDQDVSENDEAGDPEDADGDERPLMLFDIQSILLAMDKDNDGNMSMEEAKVFVIDMDRNSSVDALSLYTEDVPTNEDGQYTEEALMEWDGEGHEESRHEIHRVKFDAADADKDGFLDDEEVLHYIHPVHDQEGTLSKALALLLMSHDPTFAFNIGPAKIGVQSWLPSSRPIAAPRVRSARAAIEDFDDDDVFSRCFSHYTVKSVRECLQEDGCEIPEECELLSLDDLESLDGVTSPILTGKAKQERETPQPVNKNAVGIGGFAGLAMALDDDDVFSQCLSHYSIKNVRDCLQEDGCEIPEECELLSLDDLEELDGVATPILRGNKNAVDNGSLGGVDAGQES